MGEKSHKIVIDTITIGSDVSNLNEIIEFLKENIEKTLIQKDFNVYISIERDKVSNSGITIQYYYYGFENKKEKYPVV
jgi:hypothetical protein